MQEKRNPAAELFHTAFEILPEREDDPAARPGHINFAQFAPKKNLSVPNFISLLRILMIPVFIYFYLREDLLGAGIVAILSAVSDALDGFIARHFHQITPLGKVLDPIADKLSQFALGLCLALHVPLLLPLVLLLVVKELLMLHWGIKLLRHGKKPFSARWWGKVSTFVFYTGCTVLVFCCDLLPDAAVGGIALLIAALLLFSTLRYSREFAERLT